jgi:glyoxalase superfamily protein
MLLRPRDGVGPNLSLDQVRSELQAPPRLHLDLYTEDQACEVARLKALGSTEVHWDKRPADAWLRDPCRPRGQPLLRRGHQLVATARTPYLAITLTETRSSSPNRVWEDTVLVRTGETVDILQGVSKVGRWIGPCHIAEAPRERDDVRLRGRRSDVAVGGAQILGVDELEVCTRIGPRSQIRQLLG